jgi:hypothetical protein
LHYYSSKNQTVKINGQHTTGINLKSDIDPHRTLNEELIGTEKKKPSTTDNKTSRNSDYKPVSLLDAKINKISLKLTSNYPQLASIAGIPINDKEAKYRLQSQLNMQSNIRKNKQRLVEK